MAGVVGFVSAILSLVIAFFTAKPLARLLDRWFDLSAHLGGLINGQGAFINFLISFVIIYIIVRVIFIIVARYINRIKRDNKTFENIDKSIGIVLGLGKGLLSICTLFISLYFASAIPFIGDMLVNWIFNGSYVGRFIYDLTAKIIVPLFGSLQAFTGLGQ